MPAYPPKYRSSGIQGVVLLDVQVLATGSVGEITVKKSLMDGEGGLDEAALTSVKNWIFKPAMKDNKAVSSHVNVPVPFTLK
jgi:protein TonB